MDRTYSKTLFALLLAGLWTAGCKGGSAAATDGGGSVHVNPPDLCNSRQKAASTPACQLALGKPLSTLAPTGGRYLSVARQQDWYSLQTPPTADGRTLLHVSGGYSAPNTAVNMELDVVNPDGGIFLLTATDAHGQGPPGVIDLVTPFASPSTALFLTVEDSPADPHQPQTDVVHPYDLTANVLQDPDVNEPNNTLATATEVTLTSQGGLLAGSQRGYVSYPGDVDYFKVTVPAGQPQILFMHLGMTQVDASVTRAPNVQLSYQLTDANQVPLSGSHVPNRFAAVSLGTARLVPAGTYYLVVQQWTDVNVTTLAGDLAYRYDLQVQVMPDLDPTGRSVSQATGVTLSAVGSPISATGRLAFVGASHYFKVTVPPGANHVLHYAMSLSGTPSRFASALSGSGAHELRAFKLEPDFTTCQVDCVPNPDPTLSYWASGIQQACMASSGDGGTATPSLCLRSSRTESPFFPNLRNLEGVLPVPAMGDTVLFLAHANSDNWADDVPYTVSFDLRSDPSPSASPVSLPLGTTRTLTGSVAAGFGRLYQYTAQFPDAGGSLPGVRAPGDYDEYVESPTFELDIPLPGSKPYDQSWALQWTVPNLPDGGKPYELTVAPKFCDNALDSTCARGVGLPNDAVLADIQNPIGVWWMKTFYTLDVPYSLVHAVAQDTITARPYQCLCLRPEWVQAGKIFLTISAADKNSYDLGTFSLQTSLQPYPTPGSFTLDGGTVICPLPQHLDSGVWTAGCAFGG